MPRPVVEILCFDGCPNHGSARQLVERVVAELGVDAEVRLVNVPDAEAAGRSFARGLAPDAQTLATEAGSLILDLEATLAKLAHEDLVHTDERGAVAVAYPFSARPTVHNVRVQGHEVYAMCAIDALGIAPMFGVPITIESTDPVSGDSVRVELSPDGEASWKPEGAVVVAGSSCEGAAFRGCCHVLNFFSSRLNAESYLREQGDIRGMVISIPEAVEAGRCVFGNVFDSR